VLEVIAEPSGFLSTVQIGITMIGILSGAFGEATLSKIFANWLMPIQWLAPYRNDVAFVLVVFLITYLSIVLGELVPKKLALRYSEPIALKTAYPLHFLSILTFPFVKLLSLSTQFLLKLIGMKASSADTVSNMEVNMLMEEGHHSGIFNAQEKEFVANVLLLDERRANSIMTPKKKIEMLDFNMSPKEQIEVIKRTMHTRLPVFKGEEILGVLDVKMALVFLLEGRQEKMLAELHTPIYFPESGALIHLLELFKKNKMHLALIVDEYGDLQGLVTLNDIIEALVGDVEGNSVHEEPTATQRADGTWLIDGSLPLNKINEVLQIDFFNLKNQAYQTLAGYLLNCFTHIPKAGEVFETETLRFEIMDMDKARIDKVLVSPIK
jgi:putative hemolysin